MADERDKWLGLHEQLDTPALRERLTELGLDDLAVWQKKVDADELPAAVTAHLARALAAGLLGLRDRDRAAWQEVLSEFSRALGEGGPPLSELVGQLPNFPFQKLLEVSRPEAAAVRAGQTDRPDSR